MLRSDGGGVGPPCTPRHQSIASCMSSRPVRSSRAVSGRMPVTTLGCAASASTAFCAWISRSTSAMSRHPSCWPATWRTRICAASGRPDCSSAVSSCRRLRMHLQLLHLGQQLVAQACELASSSRPGMSSRLALRSMPASDVASRQPVSLCLLLVPCSSIMLSLQDVQL